MYRSFRSLTTRAAGVLAVASLIGAPGLSAQGGTITGRVTDTGTGEPISSAQLFLADLNLGVLTQANGQILVVVIRYKLQIEFHSTQTRIGPHDCST